MLNLNCWGRIVLPVGGFRYQRADIEILSVVYYGWSPFYQSFEML